MNVLLVSADQVYNDLVDYYTDVLATQREQVASIIANGMQFIGVGRMIPDLTDLCPGELAKIWAECGCGEIHAKNAMSKASNADIPLDVVATRVENTLIIGWEKEV